MNTNSSSPSLPDAVERVARSVLGVVGRRHRGAGIHWRENVVVASASIAWRSTRVSLVLPDGEQVQGEVRGADGGTDIAAIAFESGALPAIDRSEAATPRVGDFVFAVGRDPSVAVQASFGHIGSVAGPWRTWRGGSIDALIRLDGGLYEGFQGAPVANAAGTVLGIASSAFSRSHAVVIPVATIDATLEQLMAHGRVQHGFIGLALQPARTQFEGNGIDGLLVSSVAEGGPAARAGLQVGDVIVEFADQPATRLETIRDALKVGARIGVVVLRGGQQHRLVIEVAPRPTPNCGRGACSTS